MKGSQVCVTGASGFIGRHLIDALSRQGYSIRVLSRNAESIFPNGVEVVIGDLTLSDCPLDQFLEGCDILFHCAGEISNVEAMHLLHVNGTQHLLQAALEKSTHSGRKIHWVQLSSVGAYGNPHDHLNARLIVTEETITSPVGEYEVTKTRADELVKQASESGLMTYSILRPSNVFGNGMSNESLFKMINFVDRGLFFYIGKPGASANYIHVDNVVEGLISCGTMPSAKGRVFNISDYCTLEHFIKIIADELGRKSPWVRIPEKVAFFLATLLGKVPYFPLTKSRVKALINRSIYPISRIQKELGYKHIISMEDGLRKLIGVYKKRLQHGNFK
ncbi:MAG: NAD-dependent epimerase/dehydratase family protein [Methylotenera sp.]|nr:NAD-dependent epimerase/dehydratase family protein [Methylotenera sp.]